MPFRDAGLLLSVVNSSLDFRRLIVEVVRDGGKMVIETISCEFEF